MAVEGRIVAVVVPSTSQDCWIILDPYKRYKRSVDAAIPSRRDGVWLASGRMIRSDRSNRVRLLLFDDDDDDDDNVTAVALVVDGVPVNDDMIFRVVSKQ